MNGNRRRFFPWVVAFGLNHARFADLCERGRRFARKSGNQKEQVRDQVIACRSKYYSNRESHASRFKNCARKVCFFSQLLELSHGNSSQPRIDDFEVHLNAYSAETGEIDILLYKNGRLFIFGGTKCASGLAGQSASQQNQQIWRENKRDA